MHVLCLSFEHRTLPYMAVAVSVRTDAVAKLAWVAVVELCPLASCVGSPWSVLTPPCSRLWKQRRTSGLN